MKNIWLYDPLGYEIFSEIFLKSCGPLPTYLMYAPLEQFFNVQHYHHKETGQLI